MAPARDPSATSDVVEKKGAFRRVEAPASAAVGSAGVVEGASLAQDMAAVEGTGR